MSPSEKRVQDRMKKREIAELVSKLWGVKIKETFPYSTFDFYLFGEPGSSMIGALKVLRKQAREVFSVPYEDYSTMLKFPYPVYCILTDKENKYINIKQANIKKDPYKKEIIIQEDSLLDIHTSPSMPN